MELYLLALKSLVFKHRIIKNVIGRFKYKVRPILHWMNHGNSINKNEFKRTDCYSF